MRRGIERMYFGHSHLLRAIDSRLATAKLGRAHHRTLYFVARKPGLTIAELLGILGITKQSLSRVVKDLGAAGLLEAAPGRRDRRQKELRLTAAGAALEADLFAALREAMARAYSAAGQSAVTGFWQVCEALIPLRERPRIAALDVRD
ncbi:MAG: hypothetical protein RLZZ58_520 [Pseudomonadota bacterium]